MDRVIVDPSAVVLDADILNTNRNIMVAIGRLCQDMLGVGVSVGQTPCVPTSPTATLAVVVGPGSIYSLQNVDNTAYGSLTASNAQVVKQGLLTGTMTISCPAPMTAGQSINYLIEGQYQDDDTGEVVVPYYNSQNPTQPWQGPNNNGQAQPTVRQGQFVLRAKPGAPAATGSQVTPTADSGWTGLYVVTVAYGQTAITSGNIAVLGGAPFINVTALSALTEAVANTLYAPLTQQTPAEIAAGISPTSLFFPEGDWRRYGAITSATDNSASGKAALSVSSFQGSAAYVPPGNWNVTSPLIAPAGSSMYGASTTSSVINVANGIDGLQLTAPDVVYGGRSFQDFTLEGILSGTTNNAHGIFASVASGFLLDILFQNVAVVNFNWGIYLQNLEDCTVQSCLIQNCWQGIYCENQSVNTFLLDNTVNLVSPTTLITGSGTSVGISAQGSPEEEGLHVQGGTIYGYDYAFNFALVFEVQIEAVDISNSSICPIYFQSTVGGLVVRDCWVELGTTASGSFNTDGSSYGNGNLCGIFCGAITPSIQGKVHIDGNYIISDSQIAGSCGVFVGGGNIGVSVLDNEITGFDVGLSGGATTATNTAGGTSCKNSVIKWNRINIFDKGSASATVYSASSAAIVMNSLGTDNEVGPNNIIPGAGSAASIAASVIITVASAAAFPVGTPVQCTAAIANGPAVGVTYFVISSSGTSVTIGATAASSAISWTGTGSIGSLIQAPLPMNFNTSATAPGTSLYARGAFVMTLSDPAVSGVCSWSANGKSIMLSPPTLTGAAGSTAMSISGLPGFLAPVSTRNAVCGVENNSVASYGSMSISVVGGITVFTGPGGAAFANTGTKGLLNTDIAYNYN